MAGTFSHLAAKRSTGAHRAMRSAVRAGMEQLERRVLLSSSLTGTADGYGPLQSSGAAALLPGCPSGDLVLPSPLAGGPKAIGTVAGMAPIPVALGDPADVTGVVYSDMGAGAGYAAFPVATGPLGYDDYNSINDADITLSQMKFVGGVTAVNGVLDFEFYDINSVYLRTATFTLPSAGNYIWTLTLPAGFTIPDNGLLQVVARTGTTGQWFLSTATPTIGTQNPAIGSLSGYTQKFELTNTPASTSNVDLSTASFTGWSDDIVISTVTGTTTDAGQIFTTNGIYVDFGVGNFGTGASTAFNSTLALDGTPVYTGNVTSLASGMGTWFSDISLGSLSVGVHTVTVTVDSTNAVTETNEGNNTYTRKFNVAANYNGEIHGTKWNDLDEDGVRDAGEPGLAGWTIYLDLNSDGQLNAGEPSDVTDATGAYDLLNVPAGLYTVREVGQSGWVQTAPGASGRSNNNFKITVDFIDSSLTPSQQAVFTAAATRWAQIITGDVPDLYNVGFFIDDLRIDASAIAIDGVSNILGWAGPRLLRSGTYLPARGMMQFDTADMANMESNGTLTDVILHEMGHVLGIGTIWSNLGLLTGAGGADPRFTGAVATAQYNSIFGSAMASVPVENTGGSGTRDSHWRETTFQSELMTGWISGSTRPLSRVTAGSLQDIGYQVNLAAADAFVAPGPAELQQIAFSGEVLPLPGDPGIVDATMPAEWSGGSEAVLDAYSHEVHVDAGEIVSGIDFGGYVANLPPTDISLASTSIAENQPVSTAVGTLNTTDPDAGNAFTYSLVSGTGSTDNASFTISDSTLQTAASFDYETKNSYSIRIRSTDQGGLWYEKVFTITVTDVDETAPTVTAVYVRGSSWNTNYLSFLAGNLAGSSSTYGYAIPTGTGSSQLQTLPWRNLNQISLCFSEDVSVAQAQFAIVGSVGSYSVSGFSYNATDHVATWSLAAAIGPDKLYVAVPGSGASPIADLAGNVLDGEWSNPSSYSDASSTSVFPSGNGSAGGDFAFRFDVLPGDSTGGSLGKVNVADVAQTKTRSNLPISTSTYRSDFDGNNLVNVADVAYAKTRSSLYALPVNPPVLPVFGPMISQVSLLQRDRLRALW